MRRGPILLAGIAAIAPSLASSGPASATAELARSRFAPPQAPLVLTRIVERDLADGKVLKVARSFAIRFTSTSTGYRIDGEAIDTTVDAPPQLAAMAQLERARPETRVFPLQLDPTGRIRNDAAGPIDTRRNADAAQRALKGARLSAADAALAQAQADAIAARARAGTRWPVDLFNPAARSRHERRTIQLGEGVSGEVEITVTVGELLANGLPSKVERVVVTRIAGTEQIARETWTLSEPTPAIAAPGG